MGQVPEKIGIEGEQKGGGGRKEERGRGGGTHPNAVPMVNHQLGWDKQSRQSRKAPPKRLCKYTGKNIPGRILRAAAKLNEDDTTGVGGTTRTIGTNKEEGSETTSGVETDAVKRH